jgi:hypothetical protein
VNTNSFLSPQAVAHDCCVDPQLVEQLGRRVGTLARQQGEQEVPDPDSAGLPWTRLFERALQDGACPGGQGRAPASASGFLHGPKVAGVDADGGRRAPGGACQWAHWSR